MKFRAAVIAIVIASTGAFLVWMYLQRFEAEASGGPRVGVLMALKTVEPGSVIKDEDIGERWIPQAYVEARSIRVADRQRVVNLRSAVPLQAQQALMWTDIIVQNDDKRYLSTLVQSGMRAVTIHAEGRSQALVHPGDRVDVLATLAQPGSNDHRSAVVLLQNVLVLGRSSESNAQAADGSEMVLSLSLQSAQVLAVASDKAKLSVALRAPDDVRVQEGLTDVSSATLAEPSIRAIAQRPKTGPTRMEGTNVPGARW